MRLIDVDAMMDDINNSLNEMTNIGVCVDGDWLWAKLNDAIENAPTIDPQRKTGKWIEDAETYYRAVNEKGGGVNENTPYFTDDIACSECLAKFSVIDNDAERFDFCPNCGSYNGGAE